MEHPPSAGPGELHQQCGQSCPSSDNIWFSACKNRALEVAWMAPIVSSVSLKEATKKLCCAKEFQEVKASRRDHWPKMFTSPTTLPWALSALPRPHTRQSKPSHLKSHGSCQPKFLQALKGLIPGVLNSVLFKPKEDSSPQNYSMGGKYSLACSAHLSPEKRLGQSQGCQCA